MSDYCVEHPQSTYVVYAGGEEIARAHSVRESAAQLRQAEAAESGSTPFLWINLHGPSYEDIEEIAAVFDVHPLAFEDAIEAHQRPKFESYGPTSFMVLRPAALAPGQAEHGRRSRRRIPVPGRSSAGRSRTPGGGAANSGPAAPRPPAAPNAAAPRPPAAAHRPAPKREAFEVALGETHVFLGPNFVVMINHAPLLDLEAIRASACSDPQFAAYPQLTALHRILDRVVDNYLPIIRHLEDRADDLEEQVFTGISVPSHTVYHLSRNIMDIGRAIGPLNGLIEAVDDFIAQADAPRDVHRALRDVADHARDATDRTDQLRHQQRHLFSANATLISELQNEHMKKISAWAGIFFFPSVVAGIYGMNFRFMPELSWVFGYPLTLVTMLVGCSVLYLIFKKQNWL